MRPARRRPDPTTRPSRAVERRPARFARCVRTPAARPHHEALAGGRAAPRSLRTLRWHARGPTPPRGPRGRSSRAPLASHAALARPRPDPTTRPSRAVEPRPARFARCVGTPAARPHHEALAGGRASPRWLRTLRWHARGPTPPRGPRGRSSLAPLASHAAFARPRPDPTTRPSRAVEPRPAGFARCPRTPAARPPTTRPSRAVEPRPARFAR